MQGEKDEREATNCEGINATEHKIGNVAALNARYSTHIDASLVNSHNKTMTEQRVVTTGVL